MAILSLEEINKQNEDQGLDTSSVDPIGQSSNVTKSTTTAAAVGAGVIYNNPIANAMRRSGGEFPSPFLLNQEHDIQEDYNYKEGITGTKYEQYLNDFATTFNDEEKDNLKKYLDVNEIAREDLSHAGFLKNLLGGAAAGILSPEMLIPGVVAFKGLKAINLAKSVAAGAALATGAVGLQEAELHAMQPDRTKEETITTLAASAVLGGVFGGIAHPFLSRGPTNFNYIKATLNDLSPLEFPKEVPIGSMDKSAGAAARFVPTEGNKMKSYAPKWMQEKYPKQAEWFDYVTYHSTHLPLLESPDMKGMRSPFSRMREYTSDLFDFAPELQMHGNKASELSWENKMYQDEVFLGEWHNRMRSYQSLHNEQLKKEGGKALSYKEYNDLVAYYYNRPELDPPSAAISKQIKEFRHVIAEHNKMFVQRGKLTELQAEQMKRGDLSRVPLKNEIRNNRSEFQGILTDHFMEKAKELREKFPRIDEELHTAKATLIQLKEKAKLATKEELEFIKARKEAVKKDIKAMEERLDTIKSYGDLDKTEARAAASETIDKLLGIREDMSMLGNMMDAVSESKGVRWVHERTLDIPNHKIEKFISKDFHGISLQYIRQARQMQRYYEFLDKHGADNMTDIQRLLEAEYDQMIVGKSDKEIADLGKQLAKDKELVSDMVKVMLGTYTKRGVADKFFRVLRRYTSVRSLGWVGVSSLQDAAIPVLKHGMGDILHGWSTEFKNLSGALGKAAKKDLEVVGATLDLNNNGLLQTILDPDNTNVHTSVVEKVADSMTEVMATTTGMKHINALLRSVVHFTSAHRLLKAVQEIKTKGWKNLGEAERAYLNRHFIGEEDIDAILEQFKKHGGTERKLSILNLEEWDNAHIKQKVIGFLQKNIHENVIRPSKGDIPLAFQSSEATKTLFLFKGFFAGFTNKGLAPALQHRNSRVIMGLQAMLGLGALNYMIRTTAKGEEPDLSVDNLIRQGVSYSGMLGIMSDPLFGVILQGGRLPNRLAQRSLPEYFLGPAWGPFGDAWKLTSRLAAGQTDMKTLDTAIKLLPYQNLHLIDILLRQQGIRKSGTASSGGGLN